MADMAKTGRRRGRLGGAGQSSASTSVVPITYMNSAAALKAFCGRNGGIVCTSSNAGRVFDWAFERGEKLLFFPDEHLGRNTGVKMGIPLDEMVVWDPFLPLGGNTPEELQRGEASSSGRATARSTRASRSSRSSAARAEYPGRQRHRPPGVPAGGRAGGRLRRLDRVHHRHDHRGAGRHDLGGRHRDQPGQPAQHRTARQVVFCLDPVICPCSTMYRIHPAYVLWALEHLAHGEVVNQITVDPETAREALVALDRMLAVP